MLRLLNDQLYMFCVVGTAMGLLLLLVGMTTGSRARALLKDGVQVQGEVTDLKAVTKNPGKYQSTSYEVVAAVDGRSLTGEMARGRWERLKVGGPIDVMILAVDHGTFMMGTRAEIASVARRAKAGFWIGGLFIVVGTVLTARRRGVLDARLANAAAIG